MKHRILVIVAVCMLVFPAMALALATHFTDVEVDGNLTVDGTVTQTGDASYGQVTLTNLSSTTINNSGTITTTGRTVGGRAKFTNVTGSHFYGPITGTVTGDVTGTVTGHSTLDLPLTGGTMSGAIKGKVPGNAFTTLSGTNYYGSGNIVIGGTMDVTGAATMSNNLTATGRGKFRSYSGASYGTHNGAVVAPTSITVGGKIFTPYSSVAQSTETPGFPWILKVQ